MQSKKTAWTVIHLLDKELVVEIEFDMCSLLSYDVYIEADWTIDLYDLLDRKYQEIIDQVAESLFKESRSNIRW